MTAEPASFGPTVILVHPKERRSKCTVARLRGDPRLIFAKAPRIPIALDGFVRLGFGGPVISPDDAAAGLLIVDGTWRWAATIERTLAALPIRSLPPLVTAYPRVSKVFADPAGGLATVEALYAAWRLTGRETTGLLDGYPWADQFLSENRSVWAQSSSPPGDGRRSDGAGPPRFE